MKRTFIAVRVEVGKELKDAISLLRSELRNEFIKWVDTSNMHVTLAFLGNTDGPLIESVGSMLKNNFSGFGFLDFGISRFGLFRSITDPKVIWAGIENPGRLAEAHEKIKNGLELLDIKIEERQFNPHLTIGRIKDLRDKNNLQMLIQKFAETRFQNVIISEIVYYESILLPTGPLYKPLEIISLGQN
jgi:2'-5' RNA ligase